RMEKIFKNDIEHIFISSVVPQIEDKIALVFKEILEKKPVFLGKDIKIPIKNNYRKPEEVGVDRLLNAFSASRKIKPPLIVVDLGTAVTFDVVNENGDYEGGLIFPGMESSIDCLFSKTAKLPKISLFEPDYVVGKTTEESINSGIYWGYVSLIDGIIDKIENEYEKPFKVVITGGAAEFISKGLREGYILNRKLTMEGFYYLGKLLSKASV
ncbi:MAG: type III pantothenate kinase, partial [Aquificae bacterium]|nr:type III pantothenate kinase [Aquificota bacterium]